MDCEIKSTKLNKTTKNPRLWGFLMHTTYTALSHFYIVQILAQRCWDNCFGAAGF